MCNYFLLQIFFVKKGILLIFFSLGSLSSDSSCQLDVLWHDGDSLGVDSAQVRVFEETDQVSLAGLLK